MPTFHVTWEIDVDADNPQEAAEKARAYQIKDGTTATVFDVSHATGRSWRVDLEEQTIERI